MDRKQASKQDRKSLKDVVVDHILENLFRGRYRAGDKIRELGIAEELNVSQSVVREGISHLKALGILEHTPYTQTTVRRLLPEEMEDHYWVRMELESLAFRKAVTAPERKKELCLALGQALEAMKNAAEENDMYRFRRADLAFHRGIVEGCGSPSLLKSWEVLGPLGWLIAGPAVEAVDHNVLKLELQLQVAIHDAMISALEKENIDNFRRLLDKQFPRIGWQETPAAR